MQSECDKKEDDHLMKSTKSLCRLYNLEITTYINRVCKLGENKYRRIRRVISLPENNEIEQYLRYLLKKISLHCTNVERKYIFDDWHNLSKYILVALVVFNRKTPGETQRLEVEDYYQKESVSHKDMEVLSEEEKLQAHKYVQYVFRGKLRNSTALLIDKFEILLGIETLKYREKVGVHPNNRFLFAYPSNKDKNKTYDAYRCHRHLLEESGIKSVSLTFTNLRKQFATQVAKGAPSREEELRISNYMSHDYNIHKRIYDQSTSLVDITKVSQQFEANVSNKSRPIKQLRNNCRKLRNKGKHQKKSNESTDVILFSPEEENRNPHKTRQCLGNILYFPVLFQKDIIFFIINIGMKRKYGESDEYVPSSTSESEDEELDPIVQRYMVSN